MKWLRGTYTALVTPFTQEGHLDEKGLRENIRFQLSHAIEGLVILGTTGEAPTLSHKEKETILSIARSETQNQCSLIVGTGSYSTQQTIENTRMAQNYGADAALVVTPYYNKPTQEGLYLHFHQLAQAVSLPLIIYNVHGRTSLNLQTDTLKRLVSLNNVVGVKEASGNLIQMMEVIEEILPLKPDFSILSGDDALTCPLIAMGGHGVISVLSNIMPQEMKRLCDLALQGDLEKARHLHYELMPYMRGMFVETNPIPIKTAMNLIGHAAGPCRLPLCDLSKNNLDKIKSLLKNKIKNFDKSPALL